MATNVVVLVPVKGASYEENLLRFLRPNEKFREDSRTVDADIGFRCVRKDKQ